MGNTNSMLCEVLPPRNNAPCAFLRAYVAFLKATGRQRRYFEFRPEACTDRSGGSKCWRCTCMMTRCKTPSPGKASGNQAAKGGWQRATQTFVRRKGG